MSTVGGMGGADARGHGGYSGTFAVYWRAPGLREWRLHRAYASGAAAERERALLHRQIIAGWRVDETLIRQYPPGRTPVHCLLIEEIPVAPPLQAHNPLGPPFPKEDQLRGRQGG